MTDFGRSKAKKVAGSRATTRCPNIKGNMRGGNDMIGKAIREFHVKGSGGQLEQVSPCVQYIKEVEQPEVLSSKSLSREPRCSATRRAAGSLSQRAIVKV